MTEPVAEPESATVKAQLKLAQLHKAEADADTAAWAAENAMFGVLAKRRAEAEHVASDAANFTYWFTGEVTEDSATAAIRQLRIWDRQDADATITVVFNSPGGNVVDGMALFDELRTLSRDGGGTHQLVTRVRGYAASMGGILLQAGDIRTCGRESYLLIHEPSGWVGGKPAAIKDDSRWMDMISKRITDIFVGRSGGKCTRAYFNRHYRGHDWWLSSDQAFRLGFVDQIG